MVVKALLHISKCAYCVIPAQAGIYSEYTQQIILEIIHNRFPPARE